ncbi:MAG: putative transport system permease protein, partial [Verrucomicrobiota bacterium]
MTFSTLIRRSLRFHARSHLGVVLGAMIGSAALIGALIVGDSVRQSLRDRALSRLGGIHFAMSTGDRFFRSDLAQRLSSLSENVRIPIANTGFAYTYSPARAPALLLPGTATRQDGAARANRVNMIGVD